jgi:hypothetical protein
MRIRTVLFFFLLLPLFASPLRAQSASDDSRDSRTLQSILEELHKLRQDLQTTTAASQRAQILLYRVRLQMDTVEHLNQRLDQAHRQVAIAKNELTHFLEQKKRDEDAINESTDAAKRKDFENDLALVTNRLEEIKDNQPEAESKEAAVRADLRIEQAKLSDLQEQLDRLDRQLLSAGSAGNSR